MHAVLSHCGSQVDESSMSRAKRNCRFAHFMLCRRVGLLGTQLKRLFQHSQHQTILLLESQQWFVNYPCCQMFGALVLTVLNRLVTGTVGCSCSCIILANLEKLSSFSNSLFPLHFASASIQIYTSYVHVLNPKYAALTLCA